MSPIVLFVAGFVAFPLLVGVAKLWRMAPTPLMGVQIGPLTLLRSGVDDDLGGWGIERSDDVPGTFLIGGPRTRVGYAPREARDLVGMGLLSVQFGRWDWTVGAPQEPLPD